MDITEKTHPHTRAIMMSGYTNEIVHCLIELGLLWKPCLRAPSRGVKAELLAEVP